MAGDVKGELDGRTGGKGSEIGGHESRLEGMIVVVRHADGRVEG